VYDTNGKKYLDALAGLWATALGMYNITFAVIYIFIFSEWYISSGSCSQSILEAMIAINLTPC